MPSTSLKVAALTALAFTLDTPADAAGADGVEGPPASFTRVIEPVRQIRHAPHLRANVSNTERYVVNGVCESRGVREIAQILRRSGFEEMWAFLPRAHDTSHCQWHEIGREEKSGKDGAYLRVDMSYLEALMAQNTEIHVFHFHPLNYFECAADARCPKRMAPGRARAIDKRWISDVVFSMPSPSDVHFMMDVTSRFNRRHQGGGAIRHKVVTPYGVVDYALTDKGLAKYDAERNSRSEGLYITWVVASALDDDHVEAILRDNPRGIGAAVRQLARSLNTEFLRVEHTPPPVRAAAAGSSVKPARK